MQSAPPEFDVFIAALSSALGLIGRLMYLSQEQRSPFTLALLWELPIAIGMGLIGRGIGEYVGLGVWPFALFSASVVCGYIGPRLISWAVTRWLSTGGKHK